MLKTPSSNQHCIDCFERAGIKLLDLYGAPIKPGYIKDYAHYYYPLTILDQSNFTTTEILRNEKRILVCKIFRDITYPFHKATYEREVSIMCSIGHPNIIRFDGVLLRGGGTQPSIVMAPGPLDSSVDSLSNVLIESSHTFSWKERCSIVYGTACGLLYLHSSLPNKPVIIHNDLCIHNILLNQDVIPKICGFWFSLVLAESPSISYHPPEDLFTATRDIYAAPEVLRGIQKPSVASDIYSFGILIWELTCRDFRSRYDVLEKLLYGLESLHDSPKTKEVFLNERNSCFSQIPQETPIPFIALIKSCLVDQPELRPTSQQVVDYIQQRMPSSSTSTATATVSLRDNPIFTKEIELQSVQIIPSNSASMPAASSSFSSSQPGSVLNPFGLFASGSGGGSSSYQVASSTSCSSSSSTTTTTNASKT